MQHCAMTCISIMPATHQLHQTFSFISLSVSLTLYLSIYPPLSHVYSCSYPLLSLPFFPPTLFLAVYHNQNNCGLKYSFLKLIKCMRETVNHFKVCFNDCLSVSETHSHMLSMQTAQSPDTHIFHTLYL